MAFRAIFVFLVPFVFSLNVQAENIQLNPAHPQQYTVVRGDTLWGISGKFLQNPWQWPEVWKNNNQIQNPHLIFPGDTVYLRYVDGRPQLSLNASDSGAGMDDFRPRIRETPISDAIKAIPIDAIAQFLTSPRIVSETELEEAPYIVDLVDDHLIAGAGDQIYVRSILDPQGLGYTVYRQGQAYISPVTKETLGFEAMYIADTTLQKTGDPAKLLITKSSSQVRIGDRLLLNAEGEVTLNFIPHAPESDIKGSIISVLEGVTQIGQFNVVVIDQGSRDGIETGHVLEILRLGEIVRDPYSPITNATVKLPDEAAGIMMIFRTFERVSYGLIMEATHAINVLDKVQNP
jgi:LysM repeat protein